MPNTIEKIRKTPLVVTGIFLELLKAHFRVNSDQFRYTDDKTETRVIIEPAYNWDSTHVQKRSAIYIKRGAFSFSRIAINDQQSKDLRDSTTEYTLRVNLPVTCMIISKVSGEVERLAEETSEVLLAFKEQIRQDFGFKRFDVVQVGEIGLLEESHEFYAVPIVVSTEFTESWIVQIEALKLQQVIVSAKEGLTQFVSGTDYSSGDYNEGVYD